MARRKISGKSAREKSASGRRRGQSPGADLCQGIEHSQLLTPGERVGLAVSGGADSVALLLLMVELQQKLGITLSVLHFNHQLRGRAADADEKFVSNLAAKCRIPFLAGSADVKARAKRDGANVEDAARRARYAFFAQAARELQLNKIAVAHTADDQAETVLAHILRGTGLSGLGGIHPQVGIIVRPLLAARRAQLRLYLKSRKQIWREDATNRDVTKTRARIRSKLIPALEKLFQPRVVEHLCALSDHARADNALLERMTKERLAATQKKIAGGTRIRTADLLGNAGSTTPGTQQNEAAIALGRRLVRRVVADVKPHAGQLSATHVAKVLELARYGKTGNSLPLPGGVEVRRNQDELVFCARETGKTATLEYEYQIDSLDRDKIVQVPELGCGFRFTVIDWLRNRGETSISGEVLDAEALRCPLTVRNWRPGDRFQGARNSSAKKLKRLLNEKRIDRWERNGWPVITSGASLVWSRGFGVSAEFAAKDGTRKGIVIAEEKLL